MLGKVGFSSVRFEPSFIAPLWLSFLAFFLGCSLPLVVVAQPGDKAELREWSGLTMGPISYKVIVAAEPGRDLAPIQQTVTETLERINTRMSTYRSDSEVTRFNRSENTDWFEVSDETAKVVQRAQELSRDSGGAFDVSVKPLVELWNFGAGRGEFRIPDEETIRGVREHVGWEKLEVRLDPPGLRKFDARLQIDLSAIAKGYAVDAVAGDLRSAGLTSFFVEIGGEALGCGAKPGGSLWRVGVERPQEVGQSVQRVVELSDKAIATSGDYRNFALIDGRRYSHEIDPATGWPVDNRLASVSILAHDCMTADGLATAAMILGPEKSRPLLAKYHAEAFYLSRIQQGFSETATAGFPQPPDTAVKERPGSNLLPVFLATLLFFVLAVVGLLSGVLLNNKPLRGSCGGMSAATGESGSCGLCGGQTADCKEKSDPSEV